MQQGNKTHQAYNVQYISTKKMFQKASSSQFPGAFLDKNFRWEWDFSKLYPKLSQLPSAWDFSTYVLITLNIKYIF